MSGECFECGGAVGPGYIQCEECAGLLRREIHDIGVMYGFLVGMLDPTAHYGERGGGTHAASSTPNINAGVYDLINDRERGIKAVLGGYARDLGLQWAGRSIPQLVGELERAADMRSTMYTVWARPGIHRLAKRVRQAVTPPPAPEKLLGWCLNPLCRRVINVSGLAATAATIRCRACGCEWTVEAIRRNNVDRLAAKGDDPHWQWGAEECSQRIRALTGLKIPASTIRSWAKRGRLQPVEGISPAKYRIGDVWAVIDHEHGGEWRGQA